jgi:hypothetical protein
MPSNTEICFLDDVFYPDMNNEKIYYINLKPYIYDIELDIMIDRFLKSNICIIQDPILCKTQFLKNTEKYNYIYTEKSNMEYSVDKVISKKILHHLHTFFNKYYTNATEQPSTENKHQTKKHLIKNQINKKELTSKNKTLKKIKI